MSRNPSFTKAQVRRAVKAAESAGLPVKRVRVYPDGSIEVMAGETASVPVDSQKASLAASWDNALMGRNMANLELKYVDEYRDRAGKVRRYFRKGGKRLGVLPGEIGSEEFMTAYAAFLAEKPMLAKKPLLADSLAKLIVEYYGSRPYLDLKPSSRQLYRYALDPLSKEHGHRSVSQMTPEAIERVVNRIGEKRPGMGNLTRAVVRALMKYAVKAKWRKDNPAIGIEPFRQGEHHTWNDAELKQYEDKWRLGTRQRLAYALLLYTGQRVGDVAKMNRADVSEGLIHIVQQKTGTELWVPIHWELQRALTSYPAKGLTLIGDATGRPLKRAGLSALMRAAIKGAGLPSSCVSHGLRKAAMRRLAEAGASASQIASISGHKTLKEVERYTKAADQKTMARAAMDKVPNGKGKTA